MRAAWNGPSEEGERRRIAAGLHDDIGQTLAAARLELALLARLEGGNELEGRIDEITALLDSAIRSTRRLTFELSSPTKLGLGLEAALEEAAARICCENELKLNFQAEDCDGQVPEELTCVLYRATLELMRNVARHAHASEMGVALRFEADRIRICVEDDGVGFDAHVPHRGFSRAGGFGLFGIREQLNYRGGRVESEAPPSGGARFVLTVPLQGTPQ